MPALPEMMDDSPAPSLSGDFCRAADDFAAMQQEHQAALLAGNCKDILAWRQGRERAFRRLVRILEKMAGCREEENNGDAVRAREIMRKLLAGEESLQELVLAGQRKIQEQLLAMRKGKEVLQGYSMSRGQLSGPRYLSNRM